MRNSQQREVMPLATVANGDGGGNPSSDFQAPVAESPSAAAGATYACCGGPVSPKRARVGLSRGQRSFCSAECSTAYTHGHRPGDGWTPASKRVGWWRFAR